MACITIIIPLAPKDRLTPNLQRFLAEVSSQIEVICSVWSQMDAEDEAYFRSIESMGLVVLRGDAGRAKQMNAAARVAGGDCLWFLHADSEVPEGVDNLLIDLTRKARDVLYYFDLKFDRQFTSLMSVNEFGVMIRSHLLKIPFGDQGFFLKKSLFFSLEGYDEQVPYGEDHLLVWACHKTGIPVLSLGKYITTSSRKYQQRGWLKTTLKHLWLTAKQASPELAEVFKKAVRINR